MVRHGNPMQKIHMVHHVDVAQAIMLAADKRGIDGQIYNVADDEPITILLSIPILQYPFATS